MRSFILGGASVCFWVYLYGKKGWKFFDLDIEDFLCSRDVVFPKNTFPYLLDSNSPKSLPTLAYNF